MSVFRLPRKNSFQRFTVIGARAVLERRNMINDCIEVVMAGYAMYTTPKSLINDWSRHENSGFAKDVGPIRFQGGPPGARKWYLGSLLTMVLDSSYTSRLEAHHGANSQKK